MVHILVYIIPTILHITENGKKVIFFFFIFPSSPYSTASTISYSKTLSPYFILLAPYNNIIYFTASQKSSKKVEEGTGKTLQLPSWVSGFTTAQKAIFHKECKWRASLNQYPHYLFVNGTCITSGVPIATDVETLQYRSEF